MFTDIHEAIKRSKLHTETIMVAISSATCCIMRRVQRLCDVRFEHALSFEQHKQQYTQQSCSAAASNPKDLADRIRKIVWTGNEDNPGEMERLMLLCKH